jgi:hypothetical protein
VPEQSPVEGPVNEVIAGFGVAPGAHGRERDSGSLVDSQPQRAFTAAVNEARPSLASAKSIPVLGFV